MPPCPQRLAGRRREARHPKIQSCRRGAVILFEHQITFSLLPPPAVSPLLILRDISVIISENISVIISGIISENIWRDLEDDLPGGTTMNLRSK